MLAIIYLVVATALGNIIFELCFGRPIDFALSADFKGAKAKVSRWMLAIPGSFLVGIIVLTWLTYALGYIFSHQVQPLKIANTAALIGAVAIVSVRFAKVRRNAAAVDSQNPRTFNKLELLVPLLFILVGSILMWQSLRIAEGKVLVVGVSVWSDFGPHLAVIRSFSHAQNFPTEYPHFPNGHARYHFMFQFLCGNLEYLGLPLDWAFNLPSVLSLTADAMLLYSLAVLVSGSRLGGALTLIFYFFRSSMAWWDFFKSSRPGTWLHHFLSNDDFIGRTEHEDWGLWNQNIILNQRHLAFSLGLLWLILIVILPLYREMVLRLKHSDPGRRVFALSKAFLTEKGAWLPRSGTGFCTAVFAGALLGLSAFWNGAVVIAALLLLFGLAVVSRHRLEYLILALVAGGLAYCQNRLFLGPGSLAVQPAVRLGFLATDPHSIRGILHYYSDLLGILIWVVAVGVFALKKARPAGLLGWILISLLPLILATTVQFTPDLAINHKYVMITVILWNIGAATVIAFIWNKGPVWPRAVAVILTFCLVATGVIDLVSLINRNRRERSIQVRLDDPVLLWVEANAGPREVFLTDWWSLHPLLLSGRRIFFGWPYYAWGAGYDVASREKIVKEIYGGTDPAKIVRLLKENHLRYITIDNGNRQQKMYTLQEGLLRQLFPVVFSEGDLVILRAY